MTHMVIFRSPEGKPGYHQAEGLDEAMRFAEMLRNQEQVTEARIFRMDEVPIEFKTYYRVEMASAAETPAAEAPAAEATEAVSEAPAEATAGSGSLASAAGSGNDEEAPAEAEPDPVEAGAKGSGRHGIFSRS